MRIGLVTYALGTGGVETFLRHMALLLRGGGHEATVYETLRRGPGRGMLIDEGIRVIDASARPWESRAGHAARLGRRLSGSDIVVLNDAPYAQAALGLLGDRAVAVPVLHLPHDGMLATACGNAGNWDALVAVSPSLGEKAAAAGIAAERVAVIPVGCEVPDAWPRAVPREAGGTIRIAFVGALNHEQKGVLLLPGIAGRLDAAGVSWRLDIVGDGPDRSRLAAGFGSDAPGRVAYHGTLGPARVREVLLAADVLVMPSTYEGLGLVMLEAMAAGAVPVVSRLPGVTDFVVQDGESGFLAFPGDPASFAHSVVRLARDHELLRRMSQAAWAGARMGFRAEDMAGRYLELFERCAARRVREGARRTGMIDRGLLGSPANVPVALLRPVRRLRRAVGLH